MGLIAQRAISRFAPKQDDGEGGTAPSARARVFEVLLVDDSRVDALFVEEALAALTQVRLHIMRSGADALAFLAREGRYVEAPRPALILLDINMACMSGHEVLARIRAQPQLAGISVVMLTSSRADHDREQASALGADDFVTKPASFDEFAATVRGIVEREVLSRAKRVGGQDE